MGIGDRNKKATNEKLRGQKNNELCTTFPSLISGYLNPDEYTNTGSKKK